MYHNFPPIDVLTPVILPMTIVCFLVTTPFPGLPNDNPCFLALVQKLSTGLLLMWILNLIGFVTFSWNFTIHFLRLLWYIVITSVPSTFPQIMCNIIV